MDSERLSVYAKQIIDRYGSVSSQELAEQMAAQVEGVEINDSEITDVRDERALEDLVEKIRAAVGPVALRFARETFEEEGTPEELREELPDEYFR